MNYKTLLIKQVLPGLVVLAISLSEQGMTVFFPAESLPQPAPADEVLPETTSADGSETTGVEKQSGESSSNAVNVEELAVEWSEGYTFSQSSQNKSFSSETNFYRAGPGAFICDLLLVDSAPDTPGIWGSEIGQRSTLKSLSP